jgi:predicted Rossmann fold nucleotide-binding protein DprA/Smf involved in DNA uptake
LTGPERGFLLLTSQLGNPERKPLTVAQLRLLASRVELMKKPVQIRDLEPGDLLALGYGREMAERIVALLEEEELLDNYLRKGQGSGCYPLTRVTEGYPAAVRRRLGLDAPGCLWHKGDVSLLNRPKISLVGSRMIRGANEAFAREVGRQAAIQGYTLVSGNAVGADMIAQESCLAAGGTVISVLATELDQHRGRERVLYLAEDGFDHPFSAQRALSRNRCIHALGQLNFVAQAELGKGGTWDGTEKNLRHGWSNVVVFDDGSDAARELEQMGAYAMNVEGVRDISLSMEFSNNFLE